jgi:PAS domain S-box-containing protein
MIFLNENFKTIRQNKQISLTLLAQKLNLSRRTLWTWESGKVTPSESNIKKLAELLDICISEISNLKPGVPKSLNNFDDLVNSWVTMTSEEDIERIVQQKKFIKELSGFYTRLEQTNIILKAILSISGTKFYIKNSSNIFILANNSFKELVQVENNVNIFGSNDYRFFSKNEAKENLEEDEELIFTGKSLTKETHIPGTRKKKWGIITKQPIFDSQKNCIGLVGTFIDISERKQAEELRELLEINLHSMDNGVFIIGTDNFNYAYVNSAISKIYGYSKEEFHKGGSEFWLNTCVHPDDKEQEKEYLKKKSHPKENTYRIITASGKIKWINSTVSDIVLFKNKNYRIIIQKDITEMKARNNKIRRLEKALDLLENCIWMGTSIDDTLTKFKLEYINLAAKEKYQIDQKNFIEKEIFNIKDFYTNCTDIPHIKEIIPPLIRMNHFMGTRISDGIELIVNEKISSLEDNIYIGIITELDKNVAQNIAKKTLKYLNHDN